MSYDRVMGRSFLLAAGAVACALGLCLVGCGTVLGTFDVSDDAGPSGTTSEAGGVKIVDAGSSADGSSSGSDSGTGIGPAEGGAVEAGQPAVLCNIGAQGKAPECTANELCQTNDCKTGVCTPIPSVEKDTSFNPVCGCDNVDFYNAEVAARHGQGSKPGACTAGTLCVNGSCPLAGANFGCWSQTTNCGSVAMTFTCMGLPAICPAMPKYKGCTKGCQNVCTLIGASDAYQATVCN
jgi:hypothetical protein